MTEQEVESVVEPICDWFSRLNCLVIGPGLGRDPFTIKCVESLIQRARAISLPLVIDGDGLFVITNKPSLIKGYRLAVLTPNINEYARLSDSLELQIQNRDHTHLQLLCEELIIY